MTRAPRFLGADVPFCSEERAAAVILPVPFEGGVSYGRGAAGAPDAVIEASGFLELYDEVLEREPFRMGIATAAPPEPCDSPERMVESVYRAVKHLLDRGKFVVTVGGDHSITGGCFRAFHEVYGAPGVVQVDAHADLRDEYEGTRFSHACVMARIREYTPHTLQLGIRSMSAGEAELIAKRNLAVCTMHQYRRGRFDVARALGDLPEHVYLTVDVDAFDWSVIASTGTPEPGGFLWDEAMDLLELIFLTVRVVGVDVVELSRSETDRNSPVRRGEAHLQDTRVQARARGGPRLDRMARYPQGIAVRVRCPRKARDGTRRRPVDRKVCVIGAGNVGGAVAQRLIEKELCDVVLIDVIEGLARGKALDLNEAAPIEVHDGLVVGGSDYGAGGRFRCGDPHRGAAEKTRNDQGRSAGQQCSHREERDGKGGPILPRCRVDRREQPHGRHVPRGHGDKRVPPPPGRGDGWNPGFRTIHLFHR